MIPHYLHILLAVLLDSLFGDPKRVPHPVQLFASLAGLYEKLFRSRVDDQKTAGIITWFSVLLTIGTGSTLLLFLTGMLHPLAEDIVSVYLLYTCFAVRSLAEHGWAVYGALLRGDIEEARRNVGMICSRQTGDMTREEVCRAAVESMAENFSDGVLAPILFALVGGPLAALLYKGVNTMDSMFGYRNEEYLLFGWFSAKADDVINYLPARLSGVCICLSSLLMGKDARGAWKIMMRDAGKHASPNAGYPEAAMAGALQVQLGGKSSYFGKVIEKPVLGDSLSTLDPGHIRSAIFITLLGFALFLVAGTVVLLGFTYRNWY